MEYQRPNTTHVGLCREAASQNYIFGCQIITQRQTPTTMLQKKYYWDSYTCKHKYSCLEYCFYPVFCASTPISRTMLDPEVISEEAGLEPEIQAYRMRAIAPLLHKILRNRKA